MGNVLSEEEQEERFLEDGFNLESPDADKVINYGTAAPVWQNKKSNSNRSLENNDISLPPKQNSSTENEGQEVAATAAPSSTNTEPPRRSTSGSSHNSDTGTNNHNKNSNTTTTTATEDTQSEPEEPPKKLSYIQMAKLGYQELINAIIRPPRADYKVRRVQNI
jgi:hypothetical protein